METESFLKIAELLKNHDISSETASTAIRNLAKWMSFEKYKIPKIFIYKDSLDIIFYRSYKSLRFSIINGSIKCFKNEVEVDLFDTDDKELFEWLWMT